MNLLGEFKIGHAVLHDLDGSKTGRAQEIQHCLNKLIEQSKNDYTVAIDMLPDNLEAFLGLPTNKNDRWKKAATVFLEVQSGKVDAKKLESFKDKIKGLVAKLI